MLLMSNNQSYATNGEYAEEYLKKGNSLQILALAFLQHVDEATMNW